jgi:methionyl-tRNA formyltransferase
MRIGYFADGPWAHQAIEKIADNDHIEIAFIVPRYDSQDPVLHEWSKKLNVPFLLIENVNSPSFLETVKGFDLDLLVSMSFNQIFKAPILNLTKMGVINCHAGALPFYRGRNPLNWVLINGEKEFGITVHYVDTGIDTGDIIVQETFPIHAQDDYGTLLKRAESLCADVLFKALEQLLVDRSVRIKQSSIHPVGSYFCRRIVGDENVNFNQPARRVHNFIRAVTFPGPGARAWIGSKEVMILTSELIEGAPDYIATVGEVVGRTTQGNVIKVADSTLLITKVCEVTEQGFGTSTVPQFPLGTRFKV